MRTSIWRCGEQFIEASDARLPGLLELCEQPVGAPKRIRIRGDPLRTAVAVLRDQPGALQDRHVLLHGSERHVVPVGELGDRCFGAKDAGQDVPPGRIGQCAEETIQVIRRARAM